MEVEEAEEEKDGFWAGREVNPSWLLLIGFCEDNV